MLTYPAVETEVEYRFFFYQADLKENPYNLTFATNQTGGNPCSLSYLGTQNQFLNYYDWLIGSAKRMDSEVNRLTPTIKGTRATKTPASAGSGIWGLVSHRMLIPLQYDLIGRINCKFMNKLFLEVIDGLCYLTIFGVETHSKKF